MNVKNTYNLFYLVTKWKNMAKLLSLVVHKNSTAKMYSQDNKNYNVIKKRSALAS